MPFVLEGIWAYKLTSLLEGDVDGRSGRDGPRTRRAGMKTERGASWQGLADWPVSGHFAGLKAQTL